MADDRFHKIVLAIGLALTLGGFAQVSATPQSQAADRKIVINIPSRTLWLYNGDRIEKWFPVGVGRPGFMTPTGHFSVIRKITNPGWEHPYLEEGKVRIAPGENNPLGSRWLGFLQKNGGEFGMHGTDDPTSVGKFSSHGCVRMKKSDVETLFANVKIGTPVDIIYDPVLVRPMGNQLRVVVYKDLFKQGMPSLAEVSQEILTQYPKAVIDTGALANALKSANETPAVVGLVQPETPANVAKSIPVQPISNLAAAKKPLPTPVSNPIRPVVQPRVQPRNPGMTYAAPSYWANRPHPVVTFPTVQRLTVEPTKPPPKPVTKPVNSGQPQPAQPSQDETSSELARVPVPDMDMRIQP